MTALLVLVHWLHLLALALWIGGLTGLTIVLRAGRRVHPEDVAVLESARRRTRAILWWAIIALMVTLAAEIGLRTLATSAHADTAFTTSLRTLLFGTQYGKASVAQWLVLVASLWALDELGRAPVAATAGLTRWRGHALGIVAGPPRRPHLAMSRRARMARRRIRGRSTMRPQALVATMMASTSAMRAGVGPASVETELPGAGGACADSHSPVSTSTTTLTRAAGVKRSSRASSAMGCRA